MTQKEYARLLIVDYDIDALNGIYRHLSDRGYTVAVEYSGRRVIEQLGYNPPPHVAVVSLLTADIGGLEICQAIRDSVRCRNVPIIILFDMQRSPRFIREVVDKVSAAAYLEKPFDMKALERAIEGRLDPSLIPEQSEEDALDEARPRPAARSEQRARGPIPERRTERIIRPDNGHEAARPAVAKDDGSAGGPRLIPSSGSGEAVMLPELLLAAYRGRSTGAMMLEVGAGGAWRIEFDRGVPTLILSPFIEELSVGRLFVKRGLLDDEDLEAARRRALELERPLGEVLIEDGSVTSHELHEILSEQLRMKLCAMLRLSPRRYTFVVERISAAAQVRSGEYMLHLLKEIRAAFGLERLEKLLFSHRQRRVLRVGSPPLAEIIDALGLSRGERMLLELVDDELTLGDLIAESNLTVVDTFKLLYVLLLTGMIRLNGEPAGPGLIDLSISGPEADAEIGQAPPQVKPDARARRPIVGTPSLDLRGITTNGDTPTDVRAGRGRTGEVGGMKLARELVRLHASRATGRLGVEADGKALLLELSRGGPVRMKGAEGQGLSLGEIMVEQGWITPEIRDQALELAADIGRKIGEILLAQNSVPPHLVLAGLQMQMERNLLELFDLSNGTWEFVPGEVDEDPALRFDLNIVDCLARGILENFSLRRLEAELADHQESRPAMIPQPLFDIDRLVRNPRDRSITRKFDGTRSIGDLRGADSDFNRRLLAVILLLWVVGVLKLEP